MSMSTLLDLSDSDYALTVKRECDDVVTVTALIGPADEPETFVSVTVSRSALLAALKMGA